MGHPTAEQVAQRAFDLGLLDERQLREVWATLGTRTAPLNDLLQLLVRREFMTNYQVERLVKGERGGFFYGPYRVLYLVGTGSFARVFRAVHKKTGGVVAVKVLRSRYGDKPAFYNQFVREGRVGCTLRHPNIVPIYEVVSEGKLHYLVMEFVEGWSLREFVRIRRKIEPLEAARMALGMADALQYAFEHGLSHRDLKLSNALVSSAGQAKLVDFGLVGMDDTLSEDMPQDVPNARTVDYAALERATGVRKDDTRSDIYFLGCMFYHMLTGQAPLSDIRDRIQRMSKKRFTEVAPIQKVDPALPHWVFTVVNKAMMLDPSRRYQTPAAMAADLRLAVAQLEEGQRTRGGAAAGQAPAAGAAGGRLRSIMVVESDQHMQDVLRKGFKRVGYRVLMTGDPVKAVDRFRQDPTAADCVIFNARHIGQPALQMFNALARDKKTGAVRSVLLLDENQREWEKEAEKAKHRLVLALPITMKQLRETLAKLVAAPPG